jgi:hypothetical protein
MKFSMIMPQLALICTAHGLRMNNVRELKQAINVLNYLSKWN